MRRATFLFLILGLLFASATAYAWPNKYLTDVTVYDAEKAFNGYTLWAPQNKPVGAVEAWKKPDYVYLMDMHGKVVHKWKTPYPVWFPQLLPNGNLLVALRTDVDAKKFPEKPLFGFMGGWFQVLLELDWDGNTVWEYKNLNMHHDFRKLKNGNVIFLGWERIPEAFQKKIKGGPKGSEMEGGKTMYSDTITEVDPNGKVVWHWSALEHMDPVTEVIGPHYGRSEWTHFNSLDVMDDGNIMTDSRRTDAAYIIDKKTGKVAWRWGATVYWDEENNRIDYHWTEEGQENAPYLGGPHDCHQIPAGLPGAGNMLCYDNGMYADRSRAVEVDVKTGKVLWESSGNAFIGRQSYSHFISGAQRLPNGNTFICDGGNGKFREVTRDNEVVWEYVRPVPNDAYLKWSVFRAFRYGPEHCPQLKALGDPRRASILTPDVSKLNVSTLVKGGPQPEAGDAEEAEGPKTMPGY